MSRNDFGTTDKQEAELRRVVGPLIRPLLVILSQAFKGAELIGEDKSTTHIEQNIEDSLVQIVKYCAESDLL